MKGKKSQNQDNFHEIHRKPHLCPFESTRGINLTLAERALATNLHARHEIRKRESHARYVWRTRQDAADVERQEARRLRLYQRESWGPGERKMRKKTGSSKRKLKTAPPTEQKYSINNNEKHLKKSTKPKRNKPLSPTALEPTRREVRSADKYTGLNKGLNRLKESKYLHIETQQEKLNLRSKILDTFDSSYNKTPTSRKAYSDLYTSVVRPLKDTKGISRTSNTYAKQLIPTSEPNITNVRFISKQSATEHNEDFGTSDTEEQKRVRFIHSVPNYLDKNVPKSKDIFPHCDKYEKHDVTKYPYRRTDYLGSYRPSFEANRKSSGVIIPNKPSSYDAVQTQSINEVLNRSSRFLCDSNDKMIDSYRSLTDTDLKTCNNWTQGNRQTYPHTTGIPKYHTSGDESPNIKNVKPSESEKFGKSAYQDDKMKNYYLNEYEYKYQEHRINDNPTFESTASTSVHYSDVKCDNKLTGDSKYEVSRPYKVSSLISNETNSFESTERSMNTIRDQPFAYESLSTKKYHTDLYDTTKASENNSMKHEDDYRRTNSNLRYNLSGIDWDANDCGKGGFDLHEVSVISEHMIPEGKYTPTSENSSYKPFSLDRNANDYEDKKFDTCLSQKDEPKNWDGKYTNISTNVSDKPILEVQGTSDHGDNLLNIYVSHNDTDQISKPLYSDANYGTTMYNPLRQVGGYDPYFDNCGSARHTYDNCTSIQNDDLQYCSNSGNRKMYTDSICDSKYDSAALPMHRQPITSVRETTTCSETARKEYGDDEYFRKTTETSRYQRPFFEENVLNYREDSETHSSEVSPILGISSPNKRVAFLPRASETTLNEQLEADKGVRPSSRRQVDLQVEYRKGAHESGSSSRRTKSREGKTRFNPSQKYKPRITGSSKGLDKREDSDDDKSSQRSDGSYKTESFEPSSFEEDFHSGTEYYGERSILKHASKTHSDKNVYGSQNNGKSSENLRATLSASKQNVRETSPGKRNVRFDKTTSRENLIGYEYGQQKPNVEVQVMSNVGNIAKSMTGLGNVQLTIGKYNDGFQSPKGQKRIIMEQQSPGNFEIRTNSGSSISLGKQAMLVWPALALLLMSIPNMFKSGNT